MKDFVLPSVGRLVAALEEACRCTGTIAERFQAAEREAGALFVGGDEGVVGARFQKVSASPPNQGDPEDPPPPEKPFDDKQAYALLYALVYQINPLIFSVYQDTLGRKPTLEELLDLLARLSSGASEDLMWEIIFGNPLAALIGILRHGTTLGLPVLFEAVKEGLQGKINPQKTTHVQQRLFGNGWVKMVFARYLSRLTLYGLFITGRAAKARSGAFC